MPELSSLRSALGSAVRFKTAHERQLRELTAVCEEDVEVQSALASQADESLTQIALLTERMVALNFEGAVQPVAFQQPERLSGLVPDRSVREEAILQNLVAAYTMATTEVALFEAVAAAAQSEADRPTETLARDLQAQERRVAGNIWHLIPARSKIAFNMLTVSEIDPAVETKMADDRIV